MRWAMNRLVDTSMNTGKKFTPKTSLRAELRLAEKNI